MFKKIMAALAVATLATAPVAAQTPAYNPTVRVMNYSNSSPIVAVAAQNVHGEFVKIMADGTTISPGYNRILRFDDNSGHRHCIFTIGAVFANGNKAIRQNVNVCTTTNWKIYDQDNTLD